MSELDGKPPKKDQNLWDVYVELWKEAPILAIIFTVAGLYGVYVIFCWMQLGGGGGGRSFDPGQQNYYPPAFPR
jgi:hypothetical protein